MNDFEALLLRTMMVNTVMNNLPYIATSNEEFKKFEDMHPGDVVIHQLLDNCHYNVRVAFVYGSISQKLANDFFNDPENSNLSKHDYYYMISTLSRQSGNGPSPIIVFEEGIIGFFRDIDNESFAYVIKALVYDGVISNKIMDLSSPTMSDFINKIGELSLYCDLFTASKEELLILDKITILDREILGKEKIQSIFTFFKRIDFGYDYVTLNDVVSMLTRFLQRDINECANVFQNLIRSIRCIHGKKDVYLIKDVEKILNHYRMSGLSICLATYSLNEETIRYIFNDKTSSLVTKYLSVTKDKFGINGTPLFSVMDYISTYEMIPVSKEVLQVLFNTTDNIDLIYSLLSSGHVQMHDKSFGGVVPFIFCNNRMKDILKDVYEDLIRQYDYINLIMIPHNIAESLSCLIDEENGKDAIKSIYKRWNSGLYMLKGLGCFEGTCTENNGKYMVRDSLVDFMYRYFNYISIWIADNDLFNKNPELKEAVITTTLLLDSEVDNSDVVTGLIRKQLIEITNMVRECPTVLQPHTFQFHRNYYKDMEKEHLFRQNMFGYIDDWFMMSIGHFSPFMKRNSKYLRNRDMNPFDIQLSNRYSNLIVDIDDEFMLIPD